MKLGQLERLALRAALVFVVVPATAPATEYRQLTFFGSAVDVDCASPAWSGDATQIAFTHSWVQPDRLQDVFSTIVIVRAADGSNVPFASQYPPCSPQAPLNSHPSFSPDASKLAFVCGGVWVGAVEETLAIQLVPATGSEPDWSPDGSRIAYAGEDGIYLVPAAGGSPLRLTSGQDSSPAWSRDGMWIAFASRRAGNADIWIVAASGGEPQQLTAHAGEDLRPTWSPDGSLIVFDSDRSGNRDVWVVRVANGDVSQVTDGPEFDGDAAWSPDGMLIAFVSDRSGTPNVWVASDLRTVDVRSTSWGHVKNLYRD